ncbi:hypothetical protein ACLOAV_002684 [Pseudogymnoascus australis]
MNTAPFWASLAVLVPAVLAEPSATTTSTATASTCTSSLITTLCDYEKPGADFEFAIASSGRSYCWEYCNDHTPCDFVIFVPGNPHTGVGTCWLYPGETFDANKGTTECESGPYLEVFSKPVCAGSPTTSAGACAATSSPSAVAKVCGYEPPETCFETCIASSGASQCLSACAEAESCTYAIFNPHNPSNTPYGSGTCWVYTSGTFDAGATTTCTGAPEQYVYDNVCPKPKPSSSSVASSATAGSGGTGTAGATPGSTNGAATGSDSTEAGGDATGSANSPALGAEGTDAADDTTTIKKNSASAGLSLTNPLAMGVAVLMCLAL